MDTYLSLRIVFRLKVASENRPSLIRIDQIGRIVADDAGRTGVHQYLHIGLLASFYHTSRALHIDLVVQCFRSIHQRWRGRVDDNLRSHFLKDRDQRIRACDIAIVILNAVGFWATVTSCAEVHDGDLSVIGVVEQVDNVVAKETTTADNEDFAQGALLL